MKDQIAIVKAALVAELNRQCEEAGLYMFNEDASSTGIDGVLSLDDLAKAIVSALEKDGQE